MILKRRLMYIFLVIFIMLVISGCGNKTSGMDEDYYVEGNQEVILEIMYEKNFLFAKENIDIYVDNHKFYTVTNGDDNINKYNLTKGKHVLKVSSGIYHYAAEEFTVKNTGDMFVFSIKNHTNSIDLALTESANFYEATGTEIPETADDLEKALSEDKISAAKQNKTIWSYLWMAIKATLIFIAIALVLYCCGSILEILFSSLGMEKIGTLLELIGICVLLFIKPVTYISFILPIVFIIVLRVCSLKIKNVPKQYHNFSTIKSSVKNAYSLLYSYIFAVAIISMPEIIDILPFKISYIERYIYVYIACVALYAMTVLNDDLNYPERVRLYVEEKGIVTESEMEEFVMKFVSDDASSESVDEEFARMTRTLADLAKIGLIEKDDSQKCFKRKEK